jgi:hypothetical protein
MSGLMADSWGVTSAFVFSVVSVIHGAISGKLRLETLREKRQKLYESGCGLMDP